MGQRSLPWCVVAACLLLLMPMPVWSQAAAPATTQDALHALAAEAAIVFVGEVLDIHPREAAVEVRLRVDEALRGVTTGQVFTLREWTGLWAAGEPRYSVGQRALLLLHAPSTAGFTSPVGGADGVLPLHGDAVTGSVDLAWIATRAVGNTGMLRARSMARRATLEGAAETVQSDVADRRIVVDLLRAWQRMDQAQ